MDEDDKEIYKGFRERINLLRDEIYNLQDKENTTTAPRQAFLNKCPIADCRGFLNIRYSCGICEKKFCASCFEEKEDDHECNPDIAETVKLLKKDSKTCPKCSVIIYKIEGCNQMYCTACHTAFDWKTRKIVTKSIHNPHYFQYQRERGDAQERTMGDVPCGGLPGRWQITDKVKDKYLIKCCDKMIQFVTEIRDVHLRRYEPSDIFQRNLFSRKKYLQKKMSEKEFKKQVTRGNTAEIKKRHIYETLSTLALLLEDQMRNASTESTGNRVCYYGNIIDECYLIIEYINKCFVSDGIKYNLNKMPFVEDTDTRFYLHRSYRNNNDPVLRLSKYFNNVEVTVKSEEIRFFEHASLKHNDKDHDDVILPFPKEGSKLILSKEYIRIPNSIVVKAKDLVNNRTGWAHVHSKGIDHI